MPRQRNRRRPMRKRWKARPGGRPGELVIDPAAPKPRLTILAYTENELIEHEEYDLEDVPSLLERYRVTWVNVEGLGDKQVLEEVARLFSMHPLALEDVVNVPQRAKVEAYGGELFLVVQQLTRSRRVDLEQLGLYLGERFVLTFQERLGDPFDPIRERLRHSRGRLRQSGPDYLAYAVLDAIIDSYFPVLEAIQDHLESLESSLRRPQPDAVEQIQAARAELLEIRRCVSPLRDVTRSLLSGEWPLFTDPTQVYLRDCRDHVLEAAEQLDSCREVASGLMDIHLSTVSHQANKTMKVLTIIATIFMPLSFIAGLYGMNFNTEVSRWNMPELNSPMGYPILLGVMAVIGLGLTALFWKKGWFD